jgi:hypothetical protein
VGYESSCLPACLPACPPVEDTDVSQRAAGRAGESEIDMPASDPTPTCEQRQGMDGGWVVVGGRGAQQVRMLVGMIRSLCVLSVPGRGRGAEGQRGHELRDRKAACDLQRIPGKYVSAVGDSAHRELKTRSRKSIQVPYCRDNTLVGSTQKELTLNRPHSHTHPHPHPHTHTYIYIYIYIYIYRFQRFP